MAQHRDDKPSLRPSAAGANAAPGELREIDALPAGLLDVPADRLHAHLGGTTLIHLPGHQSPPLFVAAASGTNGGSGWDALRDLLRRRPPPLPRALSVLIVTRAADLRAQASGQPAAASHPDRETPLIRAIVGAMQRRGVYAAVDVCLSPDGGPPYAEIADMRPEVLGLARAFGPLAVLRADRWSGAAALLAPFAPALRIDCGHADDRHGLERVVHFLDRRLTETALPHAPRGALQLFTCVARMTVAGGERFSFDGGAPLQLRADLASANFKRLSAGTLIARQSGPSMGVEVRDRDDSDVTSAYLEFSSHEIRLKREVFPVELSRDPELVRARGICSFLQPWVDRVPGA